MFLAVISLITAKALYRNVGKRSLACLMPEKGHGASRVDLGGTMQPCDDDITWRDLESDTFHSGQVSPAEALGYTFLLLWFSGMYSMKLIWWNVKLLIRSWLCNTSTQFGMHINIATKTHTTVASFLETNIPQYDSY